MKQLMYFYDPDCKGCETFNEVFNQIVSYHLNDIEFEKVNVVESRELVNGLKVITTPSCILYKDDKEVDRRNFRMSRDEFLTFIFQ